VRRKRLALFIAASLLALTSAPALACSPAPTCWMQESKSYLRSICQGYAKDGKTLTQIAEYLDEPEKIAAFGEACKRVGITLKGKPQ
jgi:hypothetical protein